MEAFTNATSASFASCLSTICLYPLDTLKTRMQSESKHKMNVLELYNGIQYKLLQASSSKFFYFYYNSILLALMRKRVKIDAKYSILAGYLAEMMHLPLTLPLEVVVTKMQTSKKSIRKACRDIVEEGNYAGFYKGWKAYIVLCLQSAFQFTIFERVKRMYLKRTGHGVLSAIEAFLLGAFSRCVATTILYPYIRAKVLVQSSNAMHNTPSILKTIVDTVKRDGYAALYTGLSPELARGALSSALMLSMKEKIYTYNQLIIILLASKFNN